MGVERSAFSSCLVGYTTSILGIIKSTIYDEFFLDQQGKTVRRAINLLQETHNPQVQASKYLPTGEKDYLFKR